MNAADKKEMEIYGAAEGACFHHAIDDMIRQAQIKAYTLGLARGEAVGIIKGQESAASLIKGLRDLFKLTEGAAAGGIVTPEPALVGSESSPTIIDMEKAGLKFEPEIRGGKITAVSIVKDQGGNGIASARENLALARELSRQAMESQKDHAPKVPQVLDAVELTVPPEQKADEKLLGENPGVNFPGYFPLDVPVGDCSICDGFGVIEGEFYGAPCMIPCMCGAGEMVKATGELDLTRPDAFAEFAEAIETAEAGAAVDEIPEVKIPEELAGVICFNQGCNTYSQDAQDCDRPGMVKLCTEAITVKPEPGRERVAGIDAVKQKMTTANDTASPCKNAGCNFHDSTIPGECRVPAEERAGHPLSDCPDYTELAVATGDDSGEAVVYECCKSCKLADPACDECGLIDAEIELKSQARAIANGTPEELPRCANGSCTGNDPKAAKPSVCLRLDKESRPAIVCTAFVPVADCRHHMLRRSVRPDGSLTCDLCDHIFRPAGTHSETTITPKAEVAPQAPTPTAAAPSPVSEKKLRLQAKCTHPADFMQVIAGRGEVCTICDLTLTPETLPLFNEPAADLDQGEAGKVVEIYKGTGDQVEEPGDECDHLPLDVRAEVDGVIICGLCGEEVVEAPPECLHPAELRRPEPEMKNGERIGSLVKCSGCDRVIARFDLERKPVPPELWPENGAALGAADIRRHGYKPSELKMIKAGFSLIRYDREDRNLYRTCKDPALGRFLVLHGKTYAECERKLDELLKDDAKLVQVTADGSAADRHAEAKLRAAGFEFYRFEKGSPGVTPKIKVGSKNWGMLAKYKDDAELAVEWKKLMNEDPLALQG